MNRMMRRYNNAVVRVCREEDAVLIPAANRISGTESYYDDLMHFSADGSEAMAALASDGLKQALALHRSR
jgi:lysophospholipase L1-like esterase